MSTGVMESLQTRFLPEFLNRIDEIIVFHPLDRSQVRRSSTCSWSGWRSNSKSGLRLSVTTAAAQELATRGYDPSFGARPVKRVIQQTIQNPLATELLTASTRKARRSRSTSTANSSRSNAPLRKPANRATRWWLRRL